MRRVTQIQAVAGFMLMAGVLAAGQKPDKTIDRRIAKPAPAVVAAKPFEMKVQAKPKFPNEKRADASEPAEVKSLSVTIQPEKTSFAGNGPLAFLVIFENKAETPRMFYSLEHLGDSPKLVISNQKNANQWSIAGSFDQKKHPAAVKLNPGESQTYTLVVESKFVGIPRPRPIPLPRPVPMPKSPFPVPIQKEAKQDVIGKAVPPKIRPPRPPVVVGPNLPCGQGPCRARLFLEFKTDPIRRYRHPTWTGQIATGTVNFQIGKPEPIAVPPRGGGAMTKDRAIELAKTAAERALQADYRPVPGIKPAHQGDWITNAKKTAEVEEKKAGGWTVRWTNLPKSGFSYNVKVDVNQSGATTIREVFTSYSE